MWAIANSQLCIDMCRDDVELWLAGYNPKERVAGADDFMSIDMLHIRFTGGYALPDRVCMSQNICGVEDRELMCRLAGALLEDVHRIVRLCALCHANWPKPELRPALLRLKPKLILLLHSTNRLERRESLRALTQLCPAELTGLAEIAAIESSATPDVRVLLARLYGARKNSEDRERARKLLDDKSRSVRLDAVIAMRELDPGFDPAPHLLRLAREATKPQIRRMILEIEGLSGEIVGSMARVIAERGHRFRAALLEYLFLFVENNPRLADHVAAPLLSLIEELLPHERMLHWLYYLPFGLFYRAASASLNEIPTDDMRTFNFWCGGVAHCGDNYEVGKLIEKEFSKSPFAERADILVSHIFSPHVSNRTVAERIVLLEKVMKAVPSFSLESERALLSIGSLYRDKENNSQLRQLLEAIRDKGANPKSRLFSQKILSGESAMSASVVFQ